MAIEFRLWVRGLDDCTHEFVLAGVKGGLLGLMLLIGILATSFRQVGVLLRSARPEMSWAGFCIGASIVTHIVSFNGTAYFGQVFLIYYFTLGALQSLASGSEIEAKAARPMMPEGLAPGRPSVRPARIRHA